jgi:glycosyltransferase involved in cell wall biosynthesis
MIAPMLISIGLQNKILQAMAMKIPCVISTLANNAIGATNEVSVLIADTPEDYAMQINRLLNDEDLQQRIAENAYQFVYANYNWPQIGRKLISLIE